MKLELTYPDGSTETVALVRHEGALTCADAFYSCPQHRSHPIQSAILACIAEGCEFGTLDDEGAEYSWQVVKGASGTNSRGVSPQHTPSEAELIAALRRAVEQFDFTVSAMARGQTVSISSLQNCAAAARAAIAKAEGNA